MSTVETSIAGTLAWHLLPRKQCPLVGSVTLTPLVVCPRCLTVSYKVHSGKGFSKVAQVQLHSQASTWFQVGQSHICVPCRAYTQLHLLSLFLLIMCSRTAPANSCLSSCWQSMSLWPSVSLTGLGAGMGQKAQSFLLPFTLTKSPFEFLIASYLARSWVIGLSVEATFCQHRRLW